MKPQASRKISPLGGPEPELVAAARTGDRDAFATLYNDHRDRVFRYVLLRTRDRALAEDLTQDTFVRALRRFETFTWQGREVGAWLYTIARNLITDHYKARRTQSEVPVAEMSDEDEIVPSAEDGALRHLEIVEARETIAFAMLALTDGQRSCVRARFFEDLSVEETATVMGRKAGAVKTLQYRAVQAMHLALTDQAVAA
ncbi:sigma-70 family RNA polymerase sigma factor [Streptomyces sp. NPDC052225]|uniref:sigma-70 family RNA polymerase sigma factor n=1 Tax=Streptomyces sp. NPDC052225 TaxID=3154949 RepID=UPI00342280C6